MNLEQALNLNKDFQFMFLQSTFLVGKDGLLSSKRHFSYTSVPRQLLHTPASLCKTALSHLWPNPHCCNSRGKGNCKSFNKSQWNKGPLWQPHCCRWTLPKCKHLEAQGPWLEPRVQKLQLVVTELERGACDNFNQKPLKSHGCSGVVVFPGKTVHVYEEIYS